MRHVCAFGLCLVIGFAFAAGAQDDPEITRADLAVSLLRFELALKDAELDADRLAQVNKDFDAATLAFFQQRYGEALRQIDQIAIGLMPEIDQEAAVKAAAVRVSLEPPVLNTRHQTDAGIRVTTLYPPGPEGTVVDAAIAIISPDGTVVGGAHPRLTSSGIAGDSVVTAGMSHLATLAPGRYEFAIVPGGVADADNPAKRLTSGAFLVAGESLDAVRTENETRIASLEAGTPALDQALTAVTARNALLTDSPDPSNTAQFVLDLAQIAKEVDGEIQSIAAGTDPYAGRTGDYWTAIASPIKDFPVRIYVPESADGSKPLPLLIAFHGAGGDENMFMDAYGVGAIKSVAEQHGLLLVTPLTYAFNANTGEQFDALMEALDRLYPIDASRVFAVGHSMGGGAVTALIYARGGKLAAAATLCGFRPLMTETAPPTLVIAAELDPIASPARIEPFVQQAIDKKLPVEYRLIPDYGHTVIVGDYIDDAVAWMLSAPAE